MISGHWPTAPGEIAVNTEFLTQTGLRTGDQLTITVRGRPVPVQIAGQVYDPNGPSIYMSWQTLGGTAAGIRATYYAIGLRPGTNAHAYLASLSGTLGPGFGAHTTQTSTGGAADSSALITLLAELLAALAALGVLTCVLILTREHVHDLGIFKAVGMTPRQTLTMILCWVTAPAIAAAATAIPAAIYLHTLTVRAIGATTGSGAPPSAITTYHPTQLFQLAASSLAIAAIGALLPACWAASTRAVSVLRTE
jgi:putative ABC transport system permease protein